jgi:hypothetical protein
MKLVEAESVGPVEGDAALVTPPRPPHRRVSVSLLFTLSVLVGTVVTIYEAFPARHNVLVTEAIDRHRDAAPGWDLTGPTVGEVRAWLIGVIGKDVPLPTGATSVIGARQLDVLNRVAAVIRFRIDGDDVTYLVQHARGIPPEAAGRDDGTLRAAAWNRGPYTCVVVGPIASVARWLPLFTPG